jgi:hypothetical protein
MTVRVAVVGLLTALATVLVATPAQAATVNAGISCYDPPWPATNSVYYYGNAWGLPASTRLHVYILVTKNGGSVYSTSYYPYSDSTGYWYNGGNEVYVGSSGSSGTYTVNFQINRASNEQYLGYDNASCSI